MFKKNTKHLQGDLFGLFHTLPKSMVEDIKKSKEYHFYNLIFCNIPEEKFAVLFSDKTSRPNASINGMVAALILKEKNGWTYEQLFDFIKFNILTKIALGLDRIDVMPFCPASLFNFQNRLASNFIETGENLFEQVFDHLTDQQLKLLKIKTSIQRTDSFVAASNIRDYSRLQLLIEMIIRLYRVLSDEDQKNFQQEFYPYVTKSSGQYIYSLKSPDLPSELNTIGELYHLIYERLFPTYSGCSVFKTFKRVYQEHFTIVEEKILIKKAAELKSNSLQSPDDLDATYREKNGQSSKGQVVNIAETANPENTIELLTDIAINPNNKDDSKVLHERLDKIKEKTPDLNEIHFDGAYGSSDNDKKCGQLEITQIQTAVRGRQSAVSIEIEQVNDIAYKVICPYQTAISQPTRTRNKVLFDLETCRQCSFSSQCPAKEMKHCHTYYFTHEDYLTKKRQKNINTIPEPRRKLRNNIEATVHEFKCKLHRKKLKVRGAFKTTLFAYSVGIGINFGRIYRLLLNNPAYLSHLFFSICNIVKERKKLFYKKFFNKIETISQKNYLCILRLKLSF